MPEAFYMPAPHKVDMSTAHLQDKPKENGITLPREPVDFKLDDAIFNLWNWLPTG